VARLDAQALTALVAGLLLAAALVAFVASRLAGARAGFWAAGLLALSPIHLSASRASQPAALLVLLLLAALALATGVEATSGRWRAACAGVALGALLACGVAGFAAVALATLVWLAWGLDRRTLAILTLAAACTVAAGALTGLARSPLDYGQLPTWIPETTPVGVVRCAGASFTRMLGLEYQLVVSHARYLLPLTALFVVLMARGASRLRARPRWLLLAGALIPFVVGAAMALVTGRVAPLQADRLLAALPFVVLLLGCGLASLHGVRAWAAGSVVVGSLAAFMALAR
jgi:hypothetical protein